MSKYIDNSIFHDLGPQQDMEKEDSKFLELPLEGKF